jgi:hypothetical protein
MFLLQDMSTIDSLSYGVHNIISTVGGFIGSSLTVVYVSTRVLTNN